jgi:chromosome partitioning protein
MRILVLHTPKGGSGKSTLARELAVAADQAEVKAALADLDPQGTTTGWYKRRKAASPPLVRFTPNGSAFELEQAGLELLVVDTPPGAPAFMTQLLRQADIILVPVRPTPDDLLGAAPIARSLNGKAWAFVLCQVPPRTRMLAGAVRQLASLGRVAPDHLTFRADFPAAAVEGQAATEFPGTKAADEAALLWRYIRAMMD